MACRDWDAALNTVLGQLGDGGMTHVDADDGGRHDAGIDAGPVDAGCRAALCITHTLWKEGDSFAGVAALGPGSFMALANNASGPEYLAVMVDGGFEIQPLNVAGGGFMFGISGQSREEFFLGHTQGPLRYGNQRVLADGGDCGLTLSSSPPPQWYGPSSPGPAEAVWVRGRSEVCTWTLNGGFVGNDLATMIPDAGKFFDVLSVVALPTGERFMGASLGGLVYWKPPGAPMLSRHSQGALKYFYAVAGPDLNSVWAVSDEGGLLAKWVPNSIDGGSWTEPAAIPSFTGFADELWVRNNSDIWLAGRGGKLMHYDGAVWSDVMAEHVSPTLSIAGIVATGPDDLVIVGTDYFPGGGYAGVVLYYQRGK